MMKKILLTSFVLLLALGARSQHWFQHDAVWHYSHYYSSDYLLVKYEKDSVFGGHKWSQFSGNIFLLDTLGIQLCSYSTYTDTIYDFSKVPGEMYNWVGSFGNITMNITDTGTTNVNGLNLKYQVIQGTGDSDTLLQYIGALNNFIHPFYRQAMTFEDAPLPTGYLRCFSDSSLGDYMSYYNHQTGHSSCDWLASGIQEQKALWQPVKIYPNPSNGLLRVESEGNNARAFSICTALGEQILSGTLSTNGQSIDLSGKPKGIYLLRIQSGQTAKIILE